MDKNNIRVKADVDKCKSCGGEVKFDPKTENLICGSCGSSRDFAKSKDIQKHDASKSVDNSEYKNWIQQNKFLQCDSCGAKVLLGKYEITQVCPYCGSNFISQIDELPGLKPDAVVPFKFNEKEASEKFKEGVKYKFFVPRNFKKNLPSTKVHGVYIPAFSFDADTSSVYSGRLVEKEGVIVNSNGQYREIGKGFPISGSISCSHRNVLVETSSKLSDYDLSQILPYDLSDAYQFNQYFIKGYSVEHYQETINHCLNIAENKFGNEIKSRIRKLYDDKEIEDLELKTTYANEKYSYYLLPVYTFEYTYKNKKSIAQMNGQTGCIGRGLPVSGRRIALVVGLGLLALAGFGFLMYKLVTGM